MLAASRRVRSWRTCNASAWLPSALPKSMPMLHLSLLNVDVSRRPCRAAAALVLAAMSAAVPAADDATGQRVLDEARRVLQARADRAGLVEPRFELALVAPRRPLPA